MKKWNHNELAADLASHLRANADVMAWEDMQLGPSGSARPDVYCMLKSYSKFRPMVYECKISVSDFRSDVTSGKWQRYLDFACGVIFAVPAGLIKKEDVPPGCGLIVRHDAVWRMAKGPTLSALPTLPRDAWIKLLIDGLDRQCKQRFVAARHSGSIWLAEGEVRKKFGEQISALVSRAIHERDSLEKAIQDDRKTRDEVIKGTDQFAKAHRESMERELRVLSDEQKMLARVVGLEPDATIRELISRLRQCQRRLGEDDEIMRLRGFFDRVKKLADEGLEPLPISDGEQGDLTWANLR